MKILTAFFRYDYGIKEQGESLEKKIFLPAMKNLRHEIVSFWVEENGFPDDPDKLQANLLALVEKEKPDIVFFVFFEHEIRPETLEKLSKQCTTVNWFCDDYWRFNSFTRHIAPKLSYSVTVDKFSLCRYKKIGYRNVIFSQWAAFDYAKNPDFQGIQFKYDISFVGGKNHTREWMVSELINSGYKIECFGTGWKNGRVSYDQMKEIFLSSKINLNLSNSVPWNLRFFQFTIRTMIVSILKFDLKKLRKCLSWLTYLVTGNKRGESVKARNFEITGCGGFQLTHNAPAIEDYYHIGKEIAVFSDLNDLKLQIDYYLANEETRNNIRDAGYKRTKEYTYEKRLKNIFDEIQSKQVCADNPVI